MVGPLRIEVAGETNVGMKRNHNEDNFSVLEDSGLYIVADGMGGHASGEVASKIEVHEMSMKNGVMTMRPLDNGLTIEPGKIVKLAPGGFHLMMFDLKSPLKQGDKVPVTLEFEKAGKVTLSLDVEGIGAQGPGGAGSSGGQMDMKNMPGMKM